MVGYAARRNDEASFERAIRTAAICNLGIRETSMLKCGWCSGVSLGGCTVILIFFCEVTVILLLSSAHGCPDVTLILE